MALEILNVEKMRREEVSEEDMRRLMEIAAHPEIRKWCAHYWDNPDMETRMKHTVEMFDNRCGVEDKNNFLLLAKLDGKIVGYSQGSRFKLPHENHVGHIEVIVHPEYQRRGIGYKLLKVGIESVRDKGFKRLVAETLAENKAMRRLLEKCGFQLEGIRKKAINMHGELKDEALYALLL